MWPKVIAQLFELLPHISRVLPLADRYLSTRSSADTAITALGETVHSDLSRVAKAHLDLASRLDEFASQVSSTAGDIRAMRVKQDSIHNRVLHLEKTAATLLVVLVVALTVNMVLLLVLLLRNR